MIKVRQIKIEVEHDNKDYLLDKIIKKLNTKKENIIDYKISKKSIDARKNEIYYVYEVIVNLKNENKINLSKDIIYYEEKEYKLPPSGDIFLKERPIIVGSGPAGLFSAYILVSAGYKPIIIERGKNIELRTKDVEKFWESGVLDENSNVQFGEGGAGTFSDGKLNTLIKDKRNLGKKVFSTFVKFGSPQEIMYVQKPHIGTDILRDVIKNMREDIIKKGGEFRFNTTLTNIKTENNTLKAIEVNNKEIIPCTALVLAIGHSARDTIKMLYDNKLKMEPKPFAVGVRVMHKQEMINKNQYKEKANLLPSASYKLTYTTKQKRGVYSFCMCPGGFVVNASSERNRLAINGMSNYKRDEENANSAIIVTTTPNDYGNDCLSAIKFQRELEEKAYKLASGKIPIQKLIDFKENKKTTSLGSIKPITKGKYEFANLREILPDYIIESLLEAFVNFDKKIKGFASDDTLLAAIESRTSSPIRIIRDESLESSIKGIYPCGEGAGYSGGITSSAIDGIKVAEKIIKKYKNN